MDVVRSKPKRISVQQVNLRLSLESLDESRVQKSKHSNWLSETPMNVSFHRLVISQPFGDQLVFRQSQNYSNINTMGDRLTNIIRSKTMFAIRIVR
ncbi:hypothetical protein TNCV_1862681 [Trichonephila clavipes]|nr:hypothetical protein TNCV_1862681 [Trichonephila clavipes]